MDSYLTELAKIELEQLAEIDRVEAECRERVASEFPFRRTLEETAQLYEGLLARAE